jgi:uncharacterized protein YqiB (DUF1249 family)
LTLYHRARLKESPTTTMNTATEMLMILNATSVTAVTVITATTPAIAQNPLPKLSLRQPLSQLQQQQQTAIIK